MTRHLKAALAAGVLLALGSTSAAQQSFTCPYGKQPSCLDYSDKVCSAYSKCVDQNAACFDTWQCDYEGFTCKSNVTDLAKKYDALVDEYNELLRKSRTLASDYDQLLADSQSLADEYDDLESRHDDLESRIDDFKSCVRSAYDLDEAQSCRL
jgi:hypothetical protein